VILEKVNLWKLKQSLKKKSGSWQELLARKNVKAMFHVAQVFLFFFP
jgi:hypothetical protein